MAFNLIINSEIMKKKLFSLLFLACVAGHAVAQETLHKSTTLIGIWNQLIPHRVDSAKTVMLSSGNFKIYNVDRTFLLLVNNGKGLCGITAYGTYDGRTPGELTEKLEYHAVSQELNSGNSTSKIRYSIQDDNIMRLEYYNSDIKRWIPEVWIRVTPLSPNQKQKLFLK